MARSKGSPKGNVNYDFERQVAPSRRMGQGESQNLPQRPIMRPFPRYGDMKSGITNRWERDVEVVSDIPENNA